MSLLPEFNYDLFQEICELLDLTDMENHKEIAQRNAIFSALGTQSRLLNPDLNPLTFEEVKAWFDRKAKSGECVYHGEYLSRESQKPCHWYEIFWAKHYYIFHDGYTKKHLAGNRIPFSNLLNELSDNPLYTFCQMKGYVNI